MKKLLSVIAMGALLPLLAGDGGLKFGVKVGNSTPSSEKMKLMFKKVAPQLGGFAAYDLGDGHGVIASVDINTYIKKDKKDGGMDGVEVVRRMTNTNLGAAYTYHFNQKNDGAYMIAGADVQRVSFNGKTEGATLCISPKRNIAVGYTIGAGYDINENIGTQVSYNAHNYKKIDIGEGKKNYKQGVVNVGLTYKF
jgi:opacity protein-like surface antigen